MNHSAYATQKKIVRSVSLLGVSLAITMLISLILRMLLPRILGPEKMGVFYSAESFANLFFAFLPLGLSSYINRTVPPDRGHAREIFTSILVLESTFAVLIGLVMFLVLYFTGKSSELITVTLIMGIYSAFFGFQRNILQNIFVAIERVRLISQLNVVVKGFLVSVCVGILFYHPSLILIALIHGVSELLGIVILLYYAKNLAFFSVQPSVLKIRSILKVSLPFYMAGVLMSVYGEIDFNMLSFMSSSLEVGYYGAAFRLVGVFMLMVPILQSAFAPALSRAYAAHNGSFEILFKQLLQVLLVGSLPLSIVLLLFGDMLSRLLYGPGFEASYRVLCFLTPVLTMLYLNTYAGMCLHLVSRGGHISAIFLFGIFLNIGLDWYFIAHSAGWGPGGAGAAVSFSTLLCEIYTFIAMLFVFPSRVLDLKLIKNIVVILLPCWVAMLFYDRMIQLSFMQRIGLACLTPFYAYFTRLLNLAEVRQVFVLLKTFRKDS